MKILYVLGFLPTYVKREIEALSEAGNEITVLLPSENSGKRASELWQSIAGDPEKDRVKTLRVMPFHLFLCSSRKLFGPLSGSLGHPLALLKSLVAGEFRYFLTASETLRKLPDRWKPDVIHAHFAGDQAQIARIISGIIHAPYTVTTHATDIFTPDSIRRLRKALKGAAAVLTISEYNKRYLKETGLYAGDVTVAKLGIDPHRLPLRNSDYEAQLGVCTASGLVEKKGIDVLLKAAAILAEDFPKLRFKVIGSDPGGAILHEFREEARDLPVEFKGALSSDATLEAVSSSGFFVLPCKEALNGDKDGIPVALMEAMAMGVPSISTSLSGIPELIDNGSSGLLAEPGSPESLAGMIRKILESPERAEAMGKKGMDRVRSLHSPEESARAVYRAMEKALSKKRGS